MKMAIDCRELTREKLISLGLILETILERSPIDDLVLLSDLPLDRKYIIKNYKNYYQGKRNNGGMDSLKYHYWMKRFLEKHPVDVLYQVNQYSPLKIKGVKIISQIPDIYTLSGIQKFSKRYTLEYAFFIWRTIANSALITTVSNFTKNELEKRFSNVREISVNYNGIFAPEDYVSDDKPIIEGKYFLMLGRMNFWKGTVRVLEIFYKYFADTEYKLVLAGIAEDAEVEKAVKEYCAKCSNIILLGYITNEQRENLYHFAEMLLYASRYDGFGMPPLEAALRKTKCLMNDIPVLREVTRNTGYFIDYYGDDKAVAEKICEVMKDGDELTEKLYHIARSYTVDRFVAQIFEEASALSRKAVNDHE